MLFLASIREPSANHSVVKVAEGFMILPKPGREVEFNALAREAVNHVGPFRAFARRGDDGCYLSVHILPEEYAVPEGKSFDHPSTR